MVLPVLGVAGPEIRLVQGEGDGVAVPADGHVEGVREQPEGRGVQPEAHPLAVTVPAAHEVVGGLDVVGVVVELHAVHRDHGLPIHAVEGLVHGLVRLHDQAEVPGPAVEVDDL